MTKQLGVDSTEQSCAAAEDMVRRFSTLESDVVAEADERPKGPHEGMSGKRYRIRMLSLILVHVYIVFHFLTWYVFDIEIWGKTAMMGTPSLVIGSFNTAAIMVTVIILIVPFIGRRFCGWICHMRGAIELADWSMRKLGIKRYERLKEKNTLLNTRYRWLFRIGALFVLLLPATLYVSTHGYEPQIKYSSPPPYADLPGYENKLFSSKSPINLDMEIVTKEAVHANDPTEGSDEFNPVDLAIALASGLGIVFFMSFVMNYFWGHGAFCRILCPYVMIMVPLMNLNPWQKKITRVGQCTGCRSCSNSCPQGIDVSREIYHYDGKVKNLECIKCYACIDACEHGVLKDTGAVAVQQTVPRTEYDKRPWTNEETKNLQIFEPISHVHDFSSMIFALGCGWVFSVLGGFYFYVGAILGFVAYRAIWKYVTIKTGRDVVDPIPTRKKRKSAIQT